MDDVIVKPVIGIEPRGCHAFNSEQLREVYTMHDDPVQRKEQDCMAKMEQEMELAVAMESPLAKQMQHLKEIRHLVSETHVCYASSQCMILRIIDYRHEVRRSENQHHRDGCPVQH